MAQQSVLMTSTIPTMPSNEQLYNAQHEDNMVLNTPMNKLWPLREWRNDNVGDNNTTIPVADASQIDNALHRVCATSSHDCLSTSSSDSLIEGVGDFCGRPLLRPMTSSAMSIRNIDRKPGNIRGGTSYASMPSRSQQSSRAHKQQYTKRSRRSRDQVSTVTSQKRSQTIQSVLC